MKTVNKGNTSRGRGDADGKPAKTSPAEQPPMPEATRPLPAKNRQSEPARSVPTEAKVKKAEAVKEKPKPVATDSKDRQQGSLF
jgi:nucleoid-associated protein YgaU